ncbi:uncharacterized protein LOC121740538 [Aricia agestis]|uniref:uncharacterized protein LOC121740538 n=1 Tax=Aricia agestis TaxID=91739 RepID=UPI001C20829A|nr:uncharacterized protein LOC121740538 [Aricia agestis]
MFDSEKLILQVHLRPCLWNISEKSYSDRLAKRLAWEQIAQEFNEDWSSYTTKKKNETIDDLTKKWKHLRDYYVREKKKQNLRSGSAAPKKRITPYFEMLSFLSVSLQSRDTEGNLELPDELISDNSRTPPPPPTGTPPPPASTSSNLSASDRKKITPFQKSLLQKIDSVDKTADDPDKNFLLSMLPDMRSMTDREKFEFKFEIMSAIKSIKYNYQVSEYSPTSSTRAHNIYEYRPTSIASTSNSSNAHGDITKIHSSTDIGSPAMTELSTEDLDEILNNETSLLDNEPCE